MPLPPNPSDFPPPLGLVSGAQYIWAPADMMQMFQDDGFFFTNQFTDSNGIRYNLMRKGKGDRMLSSDNSPPSIEIHFPDAWGESQLIPPDEETPQGRLVDPDERDPDTLEPADEREFTLDG